MIDADTYFEILQFYARQMRALDALDIDAYLDTYTDDAVTIHAHHDTELTGRDEMERFALAALPRYRGCVLRHWNDNYLISSNPDGGFDVTYNSLVSRTDAEGSVTFESTFLVTDELVRGDGGLLTRRRHIAADRPVAAEPVAG